MTVDCIDWNSVIDLSKHPLGFPKSPEDQDQINVAKEIGHTEYFNWNEKFYFRIWRQEMIGKISSRKITLAREVMGMSMRQSVE